jgi:hypothetical protein
MTISVDVHSALLRASAAVAAPSTVSTTPPALHDGAKVSFGSNSFPGGKPPVSSANAATRRNEMVAVDLFGNPSQEDRQFVARHRGQINATVDQINDAKAEAREAQKKVEELNVRLQLLNRNVHPELYQCGDRDQILNRDTTFECEHVK